MAFTKMDGAGALANIAKPFDKDILKIEGYIKAEKDKKKKAKHEKELASIKADKSKAQGEKLAELQTTNSNEANQLFDLIQNALITAGGASGKAKKAYEEFNKAPDQKHIDTILAAKQSLVGLSDKLDTESKSFVEAQNDLRSDGVLKGLDSKDAAPFKALRNKLIADNKAFIVKKNTVASVFSEISTMLKTAQDLLGKDTKKQSELRASATAQLGKAQKLLADLGTGGPEKLTRTATSMLRNKDTTDQAMMKTLLTQSKELLAADKTTRTAMKTAKTILDACDKLVANVSGDKQLVADLDKAKKDYDAQVNFLAASVDPIKQVLAMIEAQKKKIK